jgi:hypothetical protein
MNVDAPIICDDQSAEVLEVKRNCVRKLDLLHAVSRQTNPIWDAAVPRHFQIAVYRPYLFLGFSNHHSVHPGSPPAGNKVTFTRAGVY